MNFNIKRQLKRTSIATNSMLVALCFVAVSCTKSELDEKERALVAKQELANNFDKLFEEAFEKPDETEQKLRTFVFTDLVSDGKNLLTDQDIRVNETLIKMAIRLKRNQNTLEQELNKKAKNLSGGMQRRLSIAMALISEPQILFLDEPTLGLDVLARRELWASIKSLKGKVTIILTTHYMDEVENLSDRVGIMTKGQLTAVGTVAELTAQTGTSKLEDAFVVLSGGVL